jgi:hypothetical protein
MHVRPDLAGLPQLRKLTLGPAGEEGEHVDSLKQLNQLRELTLYDYRPDRIRLLCQPPHALQLESITIASMPIDEEIMRALLYVPTLTALRSSHICSCAWPLLRQLPLLCRLPVRP